MHSTGKSFMILVCSVFAAGGCVDAASITAPPKIVTQSPSFDGGGGWFGTGNRTDSTTTTQSSTVQEEPEIVTADGGGWFGSGN